MQWNKSYRKLHVEKADEGLTCVLKRSYVTGYVTECGGKMHLREGEFSRAHTDFFEAFKNYDESGSPR